MGFDCYGLVWTVFDQELGITLPRYGDIEALDLIKVVRAMNTEQTASRWIPIDKSKAVVFDIVTMAHAGESAVAHVGLITSQGNLIHTEANTGTVIVPLSDMTVRNRIKGFWRFANVHPE